MDPRKLFADQRYDGLRVYCGRESTTADHVPSRVLLDEPYPDNLPVVPACYDCNNGFSRDEEYLACFVDAVTSGSVESVRRNRVSQILMERPSLAARIASSRIGGETGAVSWKPESDRVRNVVLKLARGHAAHQLSEPQLAEPETVTFVPVYALSGDQLGSFESVPIERLWPEIGSRVFRNSLAAWAIPDEGGWQVVQEGRYRYLVTYSDAVAVRMVLSEYLVCEAVWQMAQPTGRTGQKYAIRATLVGPTGGSAEVVSVWVVRTGEECPRFVTAYPEGGR